MPLLEAGIQPQYLTAGFTNHLETADDRILRLGI